MSRVLVVDDEPAVRQALQQNFLRGGWQVETASGTQEALERFRSAPFSLVVTDMRMPDGDGLKVMRDVRLLAPRTAVIFLTAFGSVPEAVEAMKGGACDYLVKPVSFERLEEAAWRVLRQASDGREWSEGGDRGGPNQESRRNQRSGPPAAAGLELAPGIVGASASMQHLMARVRQIAKTGVDVLIEAESGTGKELFVRMIHHESSRRQKPFVAANCAALPGTLLESELFGYVKGAFTGATALRAGKFELAHGGTLLLDEISELPLEHQPKLLRVLQQREVDRLGGQRPVAVDVRVVATTNRDLGQMVAEGRFRLDLYYRLDVVSVSIPPLRARKEDIPLLAEHFIEKYSEGSHRLRLSNELMDYLLAYQWPGNVRELENIVRRILALATGPEAGAELLEGTSLMKQVSSPGMPESGALLRDVEKRTYLRALETTGGNRTRAAELLGVSIRTVRNKIREFGLPPRSYA
jgi:two-component system, NtrC family, response regulator AtoC